MQVSSTDTIKSTEKRSGGTFYRNITITAIILSVVSFVLLIILIVFITLYATKKTSQNCSGTSNALKDTDECASHPCLNNGTCTDLVNGFKCSCAPGFQGTRCGDIDECANHPCLHNGTCTDLVNGFNCSCAPGYNGSHCETDIDECANHPCLHNGTCTDLVNGFNCSCAPGYNGSHCETDIDECSADSSPCDENADCTNSDGSYSCTCKQGFTGDGTSCTDIDECSAASSPCDQNADCTNINGSYSCTCKQGFSGDGASCSDIDECVNHPCLHNGTCTNFVNGFNCSCAPGYNGNHCEKSFSINSTIISDNELYLSKLQEFVEVEPAVGNISQWLLCYRASTDGWAATAFHSRCDGKNNTVTIIKNDQYVFGGYVDVPWESSTGYGSTSNAFIFSLRNKEGLQPFKSMVSDPTNAIFRFSSYGPTFGAASHAIHIANDADSNNNSYTDFGQRDGSYPVPSGVQDEETILAGTYQFSPDEVEVFYLG